MVGLPTFMREIKNINLLVVPGRRFFTGSEGQRDGGRGRIQGKDHLSG